ncbi:CmpA/NrtA family ABC transporter substrate-binding protein [Azospirillum agricola]|uniref:CmpA/NrtA family ABC transporter substrate-binding protein n=1 Tax=Azospirillum agricola TaxID=1720247 RepID=UPI000A0F05B9|nr:CmpA/NrtA family ABC transporter substrate-binding protein [Azospirillum agricola]SMH57371.1 nitrate/nitrite transport system substrate-binding protein [Azospirillum lipoferum]
MPTPSPSSSPARRAAPPPGGEVLEKTALTLGFVPLTDCAPLVVGVEKGFFARQGLEVTLSREPSWSNIRDKLMVGLLDGAHMLTGLILAMTAGVGTFPTPTRAAHALGLNGNAITVSTELHAGMAAADPEAMAQRPLTARALKRVIEANRAAGLPPLAFGVVFSVANHAYQLRYWLASAGIDPDRDVRIVTVPPPRMVASLKAGDIVGFCVGEPWNSLAVSEGVGRVLIAGCEFWNNGPEKVLGVLASWADAHPNSHRALVRALIEAQAWLDEPANRVEAAAILSQPRHLGVPRAVVERSLTGAFISGPGEAPVAMPDFHVFHRYAATFPWRSHALWLLAQMVRWGQLDASADLHALAAGVYDAELHRQAQRDLGGAVPLIDTKLEGAHAGPWLLEEATAPIPMGPDLFFDRAIFDPTGALPAARHAAQPASPATAVDRDGARAARER